MTVKYLKLVWYRFLSYKLEIARLSMGFRLNHFNVESDSSSFRRYKFSTSSFLITSRLSWKLFCPLESLSDDTAHAPYGALRHGERKHIFRNKKMFPFELARFVFFFFSAAAHAVAKHERTEMETEETKSIFKYPFHLFFFKTDSWLFKAVFDRRVSFLGKRVIHCEN